MSGYKFFAPATISNLSVGFDILGVAINGPGDEVIARKGKTRGIIINKIQGAQGKLPTDPTLNTAGVAVQAFLDSLNLSDESIELEIIKKMGIGTGLGSSAASAVAAVCAVNELLGRVLEKKDLLPFALSGERIVHSSCPADNVAPSLLGGLILSSAQEELRYNKIFTPQGLYFVVIYPHVTVSTSASRKALPSNITLNQHISQSSELAFFINAMHKGDFAQIRRSLRDHIIEDYRKDSIPLFKEVREISKLHGALGHGISGSGPSMFILCDNSLIAENVAEATRSRYQDSKIPCTIHVSEINQNGAILC